MRNSASISLILSFLCLIFSCSNPSQQAENSGSDKSTTAEEPKKVNDLTYREVVDLVFKDEGEGIEWHGEALPNDLTSFLVIEEGGPCGENDCGKFVTIRNTSEKTIVAITRGDFDINGEQGYIARKYTIAAGQVLSMGCSHLCYQGEGFPFSRTIVGSENL